MYLPSFDVLQKFAMTTNRYTIVSTSPGTEGRTMGFAQQKRMAMKEKVTFYTDDTKTRAVFGFQARSVMELSAGYDVTDEQGRQIGFFQKDFGASLMRSTFRIEGPGYAGMGQERSQGVAILRRFLDIPFLAIHFDYVANDGAPLLSVERQPTVRDRYRVTVPDQRVDFRVAACVAVAMDAMMQR